MASSLYDSARAGFLKAEIDWLSVTVKAVLIDISAYTVNLATHTVLADVALASRIATSPALASKTADAGAADAADVTFTAVTGPSIEAVIIYVDTGVEATSKLLAYLDTGTGLPITPNGGNIVLTFDNGVNRIFRL